MISSPCYCTREDVRAALDVNSTARNSVQIDRNIESASRSVEGQMRRVFYPTFATRYWDWPNYQYAYPWRVWFDGAEVADPAQAVVTTGGQTVPADTIFWGPANYGPPYTYLELNRASTSAFGVGTTPQRDISITAPFGYWTNTAFAAALSAAVSDTTSTTVQITNGAAVGVGDTIAVGTERMLVPDRSSITTGQTQQGSGCTTASNADTLLGVSDGTAFSVNEVLTLDAERLLIVDITGNNLLVKRAWDGSVLATHSGATVYASRQLTVIRGAFGTTAATHLSSATVSRALVPSLIQELTVAEALVGLNQEIGAYARTQGSGDNAVSGIGAGLPDLRNRAQAAYGRSGRIRVI